MKNKQIPLIWIIRAQHLYVDIFSWEDDDGIPFDEYRSYVHSKRAYDDYLDKLFLDDEEAKEFVDRRFNTYIVQPYGTFEEICEQLRNRGYEPMSLTNASKDEIIKCRKECLARWKEWKNDRRRIK